MKMRVFCALLWILIVAPDFESSYKAHGSDSHASDAAAHRDPTIPDDTENASAEDGSPDFGTDENGTPQQPFQKPFWNVWQEESATPSPTFKPASMLADHSYLVVVDLAAIAYEKYVEGVYSSKVNDDFDTWLKQITQDEATLTVLAVPDEVYFEPLGGAERIHPLTINLKKLRRAREYGFAIPYNPFHFLANHNGDAPFDFGTVSFRVRTKQSVSGTASIAFSFWSEEKPVAELRYATCIRDGSFLGQMKGLLQQATGNGCVAPPEANYSIIGVDTTKNSNVPDAALHLIELNSESLIGIFRCNTCGWGPSDFKQWKLAGGADWFQKQFVLTVLPGIKMGANGPDNPSPINASQRPIYNENTLNNAADSLYRLLFPSGQSSDAEAAFLAFVARAIAQVPPHGAAPSIFVRLLPQHPENAFVVPLGLTRVRLPNGTSDFLGFHFRIETPLRLQDYSQRTSCPSRWVLLMPPVNLSDNALTLARDEFKGWIETFDQDRDHTKIYSDVDEFKNWLSSEQDHNTGPESYSVMILSHHESNSLFIDRSISSIFAPIIAKRFASPSIAIIDACGTANPGAFEFVKDFNNHGVFTVIASSVEVDARMGGDFLKVLVDTISDHGSDQTYTVDRGVYDALLSLRNLRDDSDEHVPYGARVLVYGLIGNGNVRFCVPPKPSSLSPPRQSPNASSSIGGTDDTPRRQED